MLSRSFKSGKCKTSLKLGISRIKLLKNRRDIQVKQLRRELAQLLETGQEQTARIRVEHVIREEKTMSAYDLIEIYCELIVARMPIIESQKNCPIDLKEAISSVIFASPRCADIPELTDARKQFVAKYGKEFVTSALELRPDCGVNRMIVEKLSAKAPDIETKIKILTAIAKEHEVKWDSKTFEEKLQEPKEDLLNGSSSFISANKILMEPSNVNFSSNTSQSESTSKIYQTDISSKPNSFHSSSQANLRTSPLVPTPAPNESRDSDGKASTTEVKDSHPREKTASLKQPTWRMEFKDAASAAQVAAESAERASIAARAAAELATRGNFSRQNSNEPTGSSLHSSRDERPKRSMSSKLKGESDESVNMEYDQVKGFQGMKEEVHMLHRDELREEISHHGSFSDEGMDSQKDNARTFDGFRESFSRMEMGNKKNDDDGFVKRKVEVNYYDRSASASSIGSLDNDAIWFPPTDNHQSGNHDMGHNIHEIDAREKLFRDDSKEHDTRDYPTAVFDEYDPEPTDDKENLFDSFDKKHNDQPSSIFDPSTSSINSSNFSSFHHESRPVTVEKVSSSKFDDSVPVAFDDSDGTISGSDDDMSGSRQNGTAQNSSLLHERSGSGGDLNPTGEELGPSSSTKAKPLLGTEEKNHLQTSPSHVVPKDFETSDELAGGGDFGLKFGRLTGGLRNRGYSHPPYTATSVVDSPASSLETLGSTKQIISPPDKPFTSSLIEDDDPSSPIMPRASTDLESDKAKGSLSEEDYNQGSRSNKPTSTDKSEEVTTGFSVKQPVSNQEKSRRYRGVDPNPSTLVPYDSTTSASEISAASEVINQKIYDEKQRTRAYKELSSQMSKTDFDSNDAEERDFPGNMESQANTSSNTPFKLSRRTKDFTSKDRTNRPRSTGYSDMSNSKTEHRPSRRSYAPEPPSQTVDQATIIQVKHNRKLSKPNSSVESIPESSLHEEKKKTAEVISDPDTNSLSSGSNKPSDSGGGGTKLQETASQKASHVHPKLPDYETFAAHFQSLRSNRR